MSELARSTAGLGWLDIVHALLSCSERSAFEDAVRSLAARCAMQVSALYDDQTLPAEIEERIELEPGAEGALAPVPVDGESRARLWVPVVLHGRLVALLELAREEQSDEARFAYDCSALGSIVYTVFRRFHSDEARARANEAAARIVSGAQAANGVAMETLCGASQVTTHVTAVASATEEMLATVNEIGARSAESAEVSRQAHELAEAASRTVDRLLANSEAIGQITSLIGELTAQTNLLALNATIEAARAGEAGRGFAVVAGEVKALARQTASATEGIDAQIEAIQSGVRDCAEEIESVSSVIVRVDEAATAIAAAVQEQGSAVEEISTMIGAASEQLTGVVDRLSDVGEATMNFESDAQVCVDAL